MLRLIRYDMLTSNLVVKWLELAVGPSPAPNFDVDSLGWRNFNGVT